MASAGEELFDERLQGVRAIGNLQPLLKRLRPSGCERDRAGNRTLFFDHAAGLILLTFFNPTCKSLRNLQSASRLGHIRKKLGCSTTSITSLSESLRLFEPELLAEILEELLGDIPDSAGAHPQRQSHLE